METRQYLATWNRARGVWETKQPALICEHLAAYSESWPIWGMTQFGEAYELATPGQLTQDLEFLLLPTPLANCYKGFSEPEVNAGDPKHRLHTAVEVLRRANDGWGRFGPAISRWEQVIGRRAPSSSEPHCTSGAHRLSAKFTEWLIGLPEGHVTNVGLTRTEQLKALGNGVVPAQAELALRLLINRLDTNTK